MAPTDYRPRLSIELSPDQYKALQESLPWGAMRPLFSAIVDDIIDISKAGMVERLVAAIVAGLVKPREVIPTLNKAVDGGN